MKRCVATLLGPMIVLLASSVFGQTTSYNKNLAPLLPLIGKWTGDFTLQQEMQGVGKAGDKIAVMVSFEWTKNRQAIALSAAAKLEGEWLNVTDGLIVWDARQKKITGVDAYLDGGLFRYEVAAEGDKLLCRGHGTTGDGAPTELTVVYTNMKKDNFTGQFINQIEGDKRLPDGDPYKMTRVIE